LIIFGKKDTTKHVHRLHPYKGKFIPQLVQYFIDDHIDEFKKEVYFRPGDIILDPFSGSGTTLVQAHEMGMHSIGIDISRFNCMIAEAKLLSYDLVSLENELRKIKQAITNYETDRKNHIF
jgi:2-polyprenyl-3-methyl-5-hydroxy-6-metoxy-1,4-benzoquinol methylase